MKHSHCNKPKLPKVIHRFCNAEKNPRDITKAITDTATQLQTSTEFCLQRNRTWNRHSTAIVQNRFAVAITCSSAQLLPVGLIQQHRELNINPLKHQDCCKQMKTKLIQQQELNIKPPLCKPFCCCNYVFFSTAITGRANSTTSWTEHQPLEASGLL